MNTINKTAMQRLTEVVDSGQEPNNDLLKEAITQLVNERQVFIKSIEEMAGWLGRITAVHIHKDAQLLKSTLDDFVAQRVKVVSTPTSNIH
ncbi:hypothetical protein ACO0K0_07290 [Undibacterium sp. SXout11W]|uniref:hypothetical protein n=1 Tax=Undibacterium sp. SXout11W TaxID=3413050 RepID=UPI003BF254F7